MDNNNKKIKYFGGRYCKFCGKELRRKIYRVGCDSYKESYSNYYKRQYCDNSCKHGVINRNNSWHNCYEDVFFYETRTDLTIKESLNRAGIPTGEMFLMNQ